MGSTLPSPGQGITALAYDPPVQPPERTHTKARSDAEKSEHRMQILAAALATFEESDGEIATVSDVAERAGLAKGTVYLYFQTREEIYLALLEDQLHAWTARFAESLERAEDLADAFLAYPLAHPCLLRLASRAHALLERNVDAPAALRFRRGLADAFADAGGRADALAGLAPGTAARALLRGFALLLGLWQLSEPAPAVRSVLTTEDLAELRGALALEAGAALRALFAGLAPSAPA